MVDVICEQNKCTGCAACAQICAHNAISMIADEEGFLRPVIAEETCVNCKLCIDTCPANKLPSKQDPLLVLSGWSNTNEIRMQSSSGGAFTEIAKVVLSKKGVVFGCRLNEKLQAIHSYVETEEELALFRGSKYVQSVIGNSYKQALSFLREGRDVLFSGTPCQIAGLRNFLRKDYDNLYTVDIICHGVPSPLVFEQYKKYIERKCHSAVNTIQFRSKRNSWTYFGMRIGLKANKEYYGPYYRDPYIRGFLRELFLRPSCHHCKYTTKNRVSDFTIADWWGYRAVSADDLDYQQKGVSLILVNTTKGQRLVADFDMRLRSRTMEEAIKTNVCLKNSFPPSPKRDAFWRDFKNEEFDQVVNKYLYPEFYSLTSSMAQTIPNRGFLNCLISFVNIAERIVSRIRKIMKIGNVIGKIKTILYFKSKASGLENQIRTPGDRPRIYYFVVPTQSNLGDQAQYMCWLRLFREQYPDFEVICIAQNYSTPATIELIKSYIRTMDKIVIHSGYLIYDPHPELNYICNIVDVFHDRPITILPQTVNLEDERIRRYVASCFNAHPNLTLMCRDEISYKKAGELFECQLKLMPDVVTSLIGNKDFDYTKVSRKGVLFCIRDDGEKYYSKEDINNLKRKFIDYKVKQVDTTINAPAWKWDKERESLIRGMLDVFSHYQVVITDRYHGTIFSQITNTPVVVLSSNDHKLASGVKWFPKEVFKNNIQYASNLEEAYNMAIRLLKENSYMCNNDYFMQNYWRANII